MLSLVVAMSLNAAPDAGVVTTLIEEAQDLKRQKKFEKAILKLEKCERVDPKNDLCVRLHASLLASIATRDRDEATMRRAAKMYEKYLELTPEGADAGAPEFRQPAWVDWPMIPAKK